MRTKAPSSSSSMETNCGFVAQAAAELEDLRDCCSTNKHEGVRFPVFCREMMLSLPGNRNCMDCGQANPEWASVSYGTLICLQCSGRHRSYGVQKSVVRSIRMDAWSHLQVLAMLEGGNGQMEGFFDRHEMGSSSSSSAVWNKRYLTKAAQFYKSNLARHVDTLATAGVWKGREASRIPIHKTTGKAERDVAVARCATEAVAAKRTRQPARELRRREFVRVHQQ